MLFIVLVLLAVFLAFIIWSSRKRARQLFIERYRFGSVLAKKIAATYPHLTPVDVERVIKGLREYFLICQQTGRKAVAMPSQVVDVAWHEFILNTRAYQNFCQQGLGRFLHHTPSEAMTSPTIAQDGIKRAWRIACFREGINPKTPSRLPLLFALDTELNIADGFRYSLDCKDRNSPASDYCASHIGCSSGCSGSSGGSDSGSGFDGGDGGSGCGSGCGGD